MNWVEWINLVAAMTVSTALNGFWLGLLLATLAAGLVRLLPRPNATTRYTVWFVTLLLAVATPFVLLIPKPAAALSPTAAPLSAAPLTVPVTVHWPLYAALAWFAITAILMARVSWSLAYIRGLKRRAVLLGRRGNIRVLTSAEVAVPMAAGFVRRAIIFPQSVIDELSPEEFEQVLCHEMAHLRRGDDWTQLIHAIAQAVFFMNPAIYWIGRRLKIEREMACDDWVVSTIGHPRPYAACLTHLHELTRRTPAPQLAPGAITRRRWQLRARVEALLQADRNSSPQFARSGWMAACALASVALIVAAKTTPPVGVQEIPLATLAMSHPNAPPSPAISLAPERRPAPRPRLLASRLRKPNLPVRSTLVDAPVVLVRAVQVEVSPTYYVITVVFFEPPPAHALHGT